jgi:integrase
VQGYVVKRGPQSFAAVVYIGRDPETGKERRKWYSFKTRREAQAHVTYLVSQIHGGSTLPFTKLRVGEYLEQWLKDYAEGSVGPVTIVRYQGIARKYLIPALGHIPLARLSPQTIQGYFTNLLKKGLSTTTVHYHAVILHEALGHAVKWGLVARNPGDHVQVPRKRHVEMRVWDEEQVKLFLAEAKRSSPYYPLYLAALTTGMRQGELLGLRWQDVDFALGEARITQTFYRLGGRQIFKAPKTERARRTVALPAVLIEALESLRELQNRQKREARDAYQDLDLVFCQPDGKPLHAHNVVQRDFHLAIGRAKVPRIRFHDLRHCHATLLLQQGVHPKIVQERLGHATPAFTLHVYSHVLPGMQHEAADRLQERLFGGLSGKNESTGR